MVPLGCFFLFVFSTNVSASSMPDLGRHVANATLAQAQAAIDLGNRAYLHALTGRDPEAFGALFTDDAVSMPSHSSLIRGRDEIVASMRVVFAHMTFVGGTLHTITTHLEGNTATEVGAYDFRVTIAGDSRDLRGRYLTVWRRVDGVWLIAVDSSQPGAPAS